MAFINESNTFEERWEELRQNSDDWGDRMNGSIVTKYFRGVDWSEQKNWQAFFKRLKTIDSVNGGFAWMKVFWNLFDDFELFESNEFLLQYLNAIDSLSSVTTDPKYATYFAMHVRKALFDSMVDKIPEEVVRTLNKCVIPTFWKQ